jgi:hypothetical protein
MFARERDQDKEETKANFLTSCHSTFYFLWLERGGDGKRPVNTVGKGNVLARYTVVAVSVLFLFLFRLDQVGYKRFFFANKKNAKEGKRLGEYGEETKTERKREREGES